MRSSRSINVCGIHKYGEVCVSVCRVEESIVWCTLNGSDFSHTLCAIKILLQMRAFGVRRRIRYTHTSKNEQKREVGNTLGPIRCALYGALGRIVAAVSDCNRSRGYDCNAAMCSV